MVNDNEMTAYKQAVERLVTTCIDLVDELIDFEFLGGVSCDDPWEEVVNSLKNDPRDCAKDLLERMKRFELC